MSWHSGLFVFALALAFFLFGVFGGDGLGGLLAFVLFHLAVNRNKTVALLAHFHNFVRRATVMLGDEFQVNEINDILVGQSDTFPFFAVAFFEMTVGFSVGRAGDIF